MLVDLVKNKHDQKVTCSHHDVAENLFTRDFKKNHVVHSRTPWGGGKSQILDLLFNTQPLGGGIMVFNATFNNMQPFRVWIYPHKSNVVGLSNLKFCLATDEINT